MLTVPTPFRVMLGVLATAAHEAKRLPETLPAAATTVPMLAVSTAMQASLRIQQQLATYASRGDELLLHLRRSSTEPPAWATFDDSPADMIRESVDAKAAFGRASRKTAPESVSAKAAFDRIDYEHTGFNEGDSERGRWDAVGTGHVDDVALGASERNHVKAPSPKAAAPSTTAGRAAAAGTEAAGPAAAAKSPSTTAGPPAAAGTEAAGLAAAAKSPGTKAPGTKRPGTKTPGTKSPGTKTPGTKTPGTKTPGTKTPGTNAPGTKALETKTPGTKAPGTNAPGTKTLGTKTPGTKTPGTKTPGTKTPGTKAPGTKVPVKTVSAKKLPAKAVRRTEPLEDAAKRVDPTARPNPVTLAADIERAREADADRE